MLRPYQREAIDAVLAARRRGTRHILVCLPNGAGKTVIFSELAQRQVLVLAHREELLFQARDKLQQALGAGQVVAIERGAERGALDAKVLVCSIRSLHQQRQGRQALLKYSLRPPLASERLLPGPDGLVRIALKKPFRDGTVAVDLDPLSTAESPPSHPLELRPESRPTSRFSSSDADRSPRAPNRGSCSRSTENRVSATGTAPVPQRGASHKTGLAARVLRARRPAGR